MAFASPAARAAFFEKLKKNAGGNLNRPPAAGMMPSPTAMPMAPAMGTMPQAPAPAPMGMKPMKPKPPRFGKMRKMTGW